MRLFLILLISLFSLASNAKVQICSEYGDQKNFEEVRFNPNTGYFSLTFISGARIKGYVGDDGVWAGDEFGFETVTIKKTSSKKGDFRLVYKEVHLDLGQALIDESYITCK